jgi:hypothetical protein
MSQNLGNHFDEYCNLLAVRQRYMSKRQKSVLRALLIECRPWQPGKLRGI